MNDPADLHPLWLGESPLVLASGSRTRLDLLEAAGLPVEVIPPQGVDERAIAAPLEEKGVRPGRIALTLAMSKAAAVAAEHPGRIVLGGDQTLACEGALLHKPKDRKATEAQLAALSGRAHHLFSAIAVYRNEHVLARFTATARLVMRPLTPGMIALYLDAAGESVQHSVGGYQLERTGIHLFQRVTGDHSTILGLPMLPTLVRLRRLGLVAE